MSTETVNANTDGDHGYKRRLRKRKYDHSKVYNIDNLSDAEYQIALKKYDDMVEEHNEREKLAHREYTKKMKAQVKENKSELLKRVNQNPENKLLSGEELFYALEEEMEELEAELEGEEEDEEEDGFIVKNDDEIENEQHEEHSEAEEEFDFDEEEEDEDEDEDEDSDDLNGSDEDEEYVPKSMRS